MRGWRVQSVDLTDRTDALLRLDPAGAMLLGCGLTERAARYLRDGGALIFPAVPEVPFDAYRNHLYSPAELYAGLDEGGYSATPDARCYAWSRLRRTDAGHTLAAALHDHAIGDALDETIAGNSA